MVFKKEQQQRKTQRKTLVIFSPQISLSLFLKYNFVSSSIYIVHSSSEREQIQAHRQRLYTHTTRFPYLKVVFRFIGCKFFKKKTKKRHSEQILTSIISAVNNKPPKDEIEKFKKFKNK